MGSMKPNLLIDADDTLWETEIFYKQCFADLADLLATQGFEVQEALHTVEQVERERVPQFGYAPTEFCRSLVIAYQRLCQRYARPVDDQISQQVWQIGQTVVDFPIILLDGVAETLAQLDGRYRLLLLTKGDPDVQRSKLARSGLEVFFEAVHVVPEKDVAVFQELVAHHQLEPEQTWMVGNSPRSDINPALAAGLGAIYIPHDHTWDMEREEILDSERVIVLERFTQLAALPLDGSIEPIQ
jgi:putative hydrolase of the HAD superfamily